MSTPENELRIYNERTSENSLYYWVNVESDGMGFTPVLFPELILGKTDGIVTVKEDTKGTLYYSYPTRNQDASGKSGRFYVFDTFNPNAPAPTFTGAQPDPKDNSYFGFFEFTDTSVAGQAPGPIWNNGSEVDSTELPLAVKGTKLNGDAYQSGYSKSADEIAEGLIATPNPLMPSGSALANTPIAGPSAVVYLNPGDSSSPYRVLSPVHAPDAYRSFDPYLQEMAAKGAQLSILSDIASEITMNGTVLAAENNNQAMEFTGSFCFDAKNNVQLVLSGVDYAGQTWTVTVPADQLTSTNIYGCGGGTLTVQQGNGQPQTRQQNDPLLNSDGSPNTDPLCRIINSAFREICKGLNKGYFKPVTTKSGIIDSNNINVNFNYLKPFNVMLTDGSQAGNQYVQYMSASINAYTYPYDDDSSLQENKASCPLELHIGADNAPTLYPGERLANNNNPPSVLYPNVGENSRPVYQFLIGAGSGDLGVISVGGVSFYPSDAGAYNITLPYGNPGEFIPVFFSQNDKPANEDLKNGSPHIWFQIPLSGASPLAESAPSSEQTILAVSNASCLSQGGQPIDPSRYTYTSIGTNVWALNLGANLSWNPQAISPANPNSLSTLSNSDKGKSPASRKEPKASRCCCSFFPPAPVIDAAKTLFKDHIWLAQQVFGSERNETSNRKTSGLKR